MNVKPKSDNYTFAELNISDPQKDHIYIGY